MGVTINFPKLHQMQREVANDKARFRVLAAGRRWGKSRLGSALCVAEALRGGRAWWVAPSYPVANVGWRMIKRLSVSIPGAQVRVVDRAITFPSGGEVQVRSADNPDSLRGEALNLVVLDECAFMKEEAWSEALRPALADRLGRAVFISTPKGYTWFWRLWNQGLTGDANYHSWQLPTASNPYIKPTEIEAAQRNMSERTFKQEFLAEFIDDSGGVFRRIREAATATPQTGAQNGHLYILGADWGRTNDATVLTVIDATTREVCYIDRMLDTDYRLQTSRLRALSERFGVAQIVAETNSMGGPLVEQLLGEGLPVMGFTTTNASKAMIIDALALAFERDELRILNDAQLIAELQAYEAERLPGGMIRYSAPAGMHDDYVMSLALAWSAAQNAGMDYMRFIA